MGIPTTTGRFAVKEQASGWGTAETSFANANFLEAQITVPTPAQGSVSADVMRASFFATSRVASGKGSLRRLQARTLQSIRTLCCFARCSAPRLLTGTRRTSQRVGRMSR